MATLSKTSGIVTLSHQLVTHPASAIGDVQDVSTAMFAVIGCFHASVQATANTNPGEFQILISPSASGNEDWIPAHRFTASSGTAATEAMTATEASGETVLAVASTTGFASRDKIYVQDTTTLADSEWAICKRVVTNTSIDLVHGLTTGKDSADVIWGLGERWPAFVDLSGFARLQVIFLHEGAVGADVHVKSLMSRCDSIA